MELYKEIKKKWYAQIGHPRAYKSDMPYFASCARILDIGCGFGYFAENDTKRITGVDCNQKAIDQCREKGIQAVRAQAIVLPFPDSSVDGIHCAHVIEHCTVDEVRKMFSEMNRVVKKEGVIVIRSPLAHSRFYDDITHIRPYSPDALCMMLGLTYDNQTNWQDDDSMFEVLDVRYFRRKILQPYATEMLCKKRRTSAIIKKLCGYLLSYMGIFHEECIEYRLCLKKK